MGLWQNITNFFNPILRRFREFIKALFSGALEIVLAQLKDIAQQMVQEVENDPSIITDEAKRAEAIRRIKLYAAAQGIEAKDSIIALAIELAVQWLKSKE